MKAVTTAIFNDERGTMHYTPDEERDEIVSELGNEGIKAVVTWYGHEPPLPDSAELLVVDFGALWQSSILDDWTRDVIRWAEDHPGSLVMLWSGMTADEFGRELSERARRAYGRSIDKWAAWPDNVRALHPGHDYNVDWGDDAGKDGVDWLQDSFDKLTRWFAIEKDQPCRDVECGNTDPHSESDHEDKTLVTPPGVQATYDRLVEAYEAEPTVPDNGGGAPGDRYPL